MRTSHALVFAILILGISASLDLKVSHAESLGEPNPGKGDDHGSHNFRGQISSDLKGNLRVVNFETAIEDISPSRPIHNYEALAHHVVDSAREALGFDAVLSDDVLARLAWSFRLRHMPEPIIVARNSTRGDADRLVRYVLTSKEVKKAHHFTEYEIQRLIKRVKDSAEIGQGFVFRIIEGADNEYEPLHLHQLAARQHYFAAVHDKTDLYVTFVGSEVLGEFIKGHGGPNAVAERADAAQFLRQWLLNQWVNLWICTNAHSN